MAQPHIFVSHSHQDDEFTQRLVDDLHRAGAEVWVDKAGLTHGNFMQRIDEALAKCQWMVLVLTPHAIASEFVKSEVYAALLSVKQGYMRDVIPILAAPCDDHLIPPQWRVLHRYDATRDYDAALAGVIRAVGLSPAAVAPSPAPAAIPARPSSPSIPPERFPPHLAQLGFVWRILNGVEVIVPPVCDVPAGEFIMGSDPRQDREAGKDEKPQHRVTLPAYQIGRYSITVAEYACFVRAGHVEPLPGWGARATWRMQLGRLDHPVVNVSWRDAVNYAAWLAELAGEPWRLPSEAEWEKAARGTDGRIYPWGDAFDQARCNTRGTGKGTTTPVGTYPASASPCGAQDMAGNVWEWTNSLFNRYPFQADDGRERANSTGNRVARGGSWNGNPRVARAANRGHDDPDGVDDDLGLRVARAVPGS